MPANQQRLHLFPQARRLPTLRSRAVLITVEGNRPNKKGAS
jgi:hypothetical protein